MIDADEYQSAVEMLRAKGVEIFFEEDRRGGVIDGPRVYFRDPDGSALEFINRTGYAGSRLPAHTGGYTGYASASAQGQDCAQRIDNQTWIKLGQPEEIAHGHKEQIGPDRQADGDFPGFPGREPEEQERGE